MRTMKRIVVGALAPLAAVTAISGAMPRAWAQAVVDGDRVAQILDNLIGNAVETADEPGARIEIGLERPSANEALIDVADTGPGVLSAHVDRLFEPFFTTRAGGTGLGLFLSGELARAMGGEVRYRPRTGGGACFEVRLPC